MVGQEKKKLELIASEKAHGWIIIIILDWFSFLLLKKILSKKQLFSISNNLPFRIML
jgi:hypothetical protein